MEHDESQEYLSYIKEFRIQLTEPVIEAHLIACSAHECIDLCYHLWDERFPSLVRSGFEKERELFHTELINASEYIRDNSHLRGVLDTKGVRTEEFLKLCAGNSLLLTVEWLIEESLQTNKEELTLIHVEKPTLIEAIKVHPKVSRRVHAQPWNQVGDINDIPCLASNPNDSWIARGVGTLLESIDALPDIWTLDAILFYRAELRGKGFYSNFASRIAGIATRPNQYESPSNVLAHTLFATFHELRHATQARLPLLLQEIDAMFYTLHMAHKITGNYEQLEEVLQGLGGNFFEFGKAFSKSYGNAADNRVDLFSRMTSPHLEERLTIDHNIYSWVRQNSCEVPY